MDTAASLVRLAADLEAGRLPLPEDRDLLARAVVRWLDLGETLDAAFGLAGGAAGRRSARTIYRTAQRNAALRRAHALMGGPGPWRRSVQLAAEVSAFEGRIWPRWCNLDAPPAEASELRRALFAAAQAAKPGALPGSARTLHDICGPR